MDRPNLTHRAAAILLVLAVPVLSSCSVGMAMSGTDDPNLAACRVGATRADIQAEVGPPIFTEVRDDGETECTYEDQLGNEPSIGRAVAHGSLDVLTFGLWEIVGTPVEAVQGETYQMTVVYGADGRATSITSRPAP